MDAWFEAGCPNVAPTSKSRHARPKSENTILNARQLLGTSVRPVIGRLWVDRTSTDRLEKLFQGMANKGYATSTVDRTWNYLNQACQHAVRTRTAKTNPAAAVLLPAARPPKPRKSFTIEQAERLLVDAIPADSRPAMWITGLMCGLRPGEIARLRWPFVDIDSRSPSIEVAERAFEVEDRYVGQAAPKTRRGYRRIGLHPLLVAALRRHREEMQLLELYDPEGFVFCTRNGTPMTLNNLRRAFQQLCARAGLGSTGRRTSCATPSCPSSRTSSTTSSKSPTWPATATPERPRATATPCGRRCPRHRRLGPSAGSRGFAGGRGGRRLERCPARHAPWAAVSTCTA